MDLLLFPHIDQLAALCAFLIGSRNPRNPALAIAVGQKQAERIEPSYTHISALGFVDLLFSLLTVPPLPAASERLET